jgi:PAS domain S-box-containing protein
MRSSLALKLLLLVLVAAVPVLAVQVFDQLREREEQREAIAADALRSADLLAQRLSQIVEAARALATATGHLPEVRQLDGQACSVRVRALREHFPAFVGIGVMTPDGDSFCRSTPGDDRVINIADRPYFQQALQAKRFVASGYMIGRAIGRPSWVFAAPVLGEAEEVLAVVVVAFDLANVADMLAEVALPAGGTASMLDSGGVLVARVPPHAEDDLPQIRHEAFMEILRAQLRGTAVGVGTDGVERVYGFVPLNPPAEFRAVVGLPLAASLATIDRRLWWNLSLLGAIFVAAATAALIAGELAIRRPLVALQKLARRLAGGDLSARADLDRRALGEVGVLAASLHEMAGALDERQRELRASEEFNRRILESSRDCIKVLDLEGRLLSINECGRRYLEIEDVAEVLNASYLDLWQGENRAAAEGALRQALSGSAGRFLGYFRAPSGNESWWDEVVTPIFAGDGRPERLLVVSRDVTEAKHAEERRELLMAELDHRVKNNFATVLAVARQTLRRGPDAEAFAGRLEAMARAHDLLSRNQWEGADLAVLLRTMLEPYGERVRLSGPPVRLEPRMVQTLGMAIHELATNAAKHGALSAAGGRVAVAWRHWVDGTRRLTLEWQEQRGPPVERPGRWGFGLTLLERSLRHELAGTTRLEFEPEGLRAVIDLQLGGPAATPRGEEPAQTPREPMMQGAARLVGKRILLVEDAALAAMELEAVLTDAGCIVVGPAARLDQACRMAARGPLDGALLDVNLGGELVFPLAHQLRAAGVPFVFVSGYDSRAIFPPEFKDAPCLGKPVGEQALLAALVAIMPDAPANDAHLEAGGAGPPGGGGTVRDAG